MPENMIVMNVQDALALARALQLVDYQLQSIDPDAYRVVVKFREALYQTGPKAADPSVGKS